MHSNGVNGSSNKTLSEQQALSLALLKNTQISGSGLLPADNQSKGLLDFLTEKVSISDEAKDKLASEQLVTKFAQIASRLKEPFDFEKVKAVQNQLSAQGTSGYLQKLNPNELASNMLQSFWG